ncbi:hypothetical protein [Massilia genomosp. 1]|uniref:Uncharacterized protein n=1 Tax=Massilia genomosp. 1 TaxID=2609280 RepID=A0ABX0N1U3_9BURK|nr:hypothetical protein [Massilia genomosp. 1]NHZ66628.1 hypothetical protein [Massilia genomosp. 1]
MSERTTTQDEQDGIEWFNSLTETGRAEWLNRAGSAVPADAWQEFKRYQAKYSYEVNPRAGELGGGWRLRLLEDGEEVGGGVFPPVEGIEDDQESDKAAYSDAMDEGEDWLASRQ